MRSTIIRDTVHQVIYEQYIGMIVLGYGGALEYNDNRKKNGR